MIFKPLLLERHLTHLQAAAYAILGYFLFAVSDTMAKYLMGEGFTKSQVIVLTSLPSFLVLSIFMIKRHGLARAFHTPYKTLHIGRCLGLIGVTFFGFQALTFLPLADFYGVTFSSPFIITIGAFFIFKEKTSLGEWLAILIGFGGVLIVVQPDYNHFNVGYILAFAAVLSISAAALLVRKIGRDEDPYLFVIFGNIGLLLANIIPFINSNIPEIFNLTHLMIFLIYCWTIPTAILVMSAVFARAPSVTSVAPFQYLQIIWGSILGYFIFGDIPQLNTLIGSVIVIACGLYILFHHKRKRRKELI